MEWFNKNQYLNIFICYSAKKIKLTVNFHILHALLLINGVYERIFEAGHITFV